MIPLNKSKKSYPYNINIKHIAIARKSRAALRKIKDFLWGNALDAIECGDWWIPFDSYDYDAIKEHLETKVFHEFFKLPKDLKITIKTFITDILSFN